LTASTAYGGVRSRDQSCTCAAVNAVSNRNATFAGLKRATITRVRHASPVPANESSPHSSPAAPAFHWTRRASGASRHTLGADAEDQNVCHVPSDTRTARAETGSGAESRARWALPACAMIPHHPIHIHTSALPRRTTGITPRTTTKLPRRYHTMITRIYVFITRV
jgi:hypothetical protein